MECNHNHELKVHNSKNPDTEHPDQVREKLTEVKCGDCFFISRSKSSLKVHIQTNHLGQAFLCGICSYEAKYSHLLKEHSKNEHSMKNTGNIGVGVSTTKRTYKRRNVSTKNYGWGNKRKLLNIKVTRNASDEGTDDSNDIQEPNDLMKHVKRDLTDRKYHCELCSLFSHVARGNARNHVEARHFPNMFTYHCDLCDKTYSSRDTYASHRSIKHNLKNTETDGKQKKKHTLKKKETDGKPRKKRMLKKKETDGKPKKKITNKKPKKITVKKNPDAVDNDDIKDPSDLTKFVSKDLTDDKYSCTVCTSFSHNSIIGTRTHVETSHFPDMFTYCCDQCDGVFSTLGNCRIHIYRKHTVPINTTIMKPGLNSEKKSKQKSNSHKSDFMIDSREILSYEAEEIEIKVEANLEKDLDICLKKKIQERTRRNKNLNTENVIKDGSTKEIIDTLLTIHNISEPDDIFAKSNGQDLYIVKDASKVLAKRCTGSEMSTVHDIKEPVDLFKFVKRDPTSLKFTCSLCKIFSETSMFLTRNHVESSHFPHMFTYTCYQCGSGFSTWDSLFQHKSSQHKSSQHNSILSD